LHRLVLKIGEANQRGGPTGCGADRTGASDSAPGAPGGSPTTPAGPKRFHGTVTLDATRVGRDAGRIADEVVAHLSGLVGSTVKVTLEIEADVSAQVACRRMRTFGQLRRICATMRATSSVAPAAASMLALRSLAANRWRPQNT